MAALDHAFELMQAQRDVIQRLNADLERRVAERTAQIETSGKELEDFTYTVSHDLRTPLRAIDGFSRILEEDYGGKLDDEARRLIGVVRENARKMGQLIDDLLTFSRLGRNPIAATGIDMGALARSALAEIGAPAAVGRARIEIHPLPEAWGDPALIKQVWTHLLSNAIKFSGKREHPAIEVSGRENGAESVYCVKDNGAGFDMKYYDKLFGVFQRLHSAQAFAGTGVGLAIVRRMVSRHGGRVWAEGKVDQGAAFYFSLPKGRQDGQI
jgi:light-regulated signal transduction histidine kinase (bacteriophytochrome)